MEEMNLSPCSGHTNRNQVEITQGEVLLNNNPGKVLLNTENKLLKFGDN